jgi:hypothetical protein
MLMEGEQPLEVWMSKCGGQLRNIEVLSVLSVGAPRPEITALRLELLLRTRSRWGSCHSEPVWV